MKKLSKQKREERALDAIIACCLRGWGQKEWEELYRRMDAKERQQTQETLRHREQHSGDIY